MHTNPHTARVMSNGKSGKSASNGSKGISSGPVSADKFPGGNWPSKVTGGKSGGNRGQGPKT